MHQFLHPLFLLLALYAFLCSQVFAMEKPNILVFYADDMGYGDLERLPLIISG